ncbi:MAG TPA: FG-GAP-like repeat-containing protein [Bryobacteraceae bacterium]|nr:FG-GAP-like repeat-containing protein [Bryobacteraceae bacterium]
MHLRALFLSFLLSIPLNAQSTCPAFQFLSARTINLKPSSTSHIDVVRQNDGSYTGYEVADAPPYRTIATTPHFEEQFSGCLPHTLPSPPNGLAPPANPPGAGSQLQASMMLPSRNYFAARIEYQNGGPLAITSTIDFDIFDSHLGLISERIFSSPDETELFSAVGLADLNGDGKNDLIAIGQIPTGHGFAFSGVWVFLGNGDGTFQTGKRQALTGFGLRVSGSFAVGDVNRDGKPDLVIALDLLPVLVDLGNGDGTFTQGTNSRSGGQDDVSVALADVNSDGKLDLLSGPAVIGYNNAPNYQVANLSVSLGNGDGTFQTPTSFPVRFGGGKAAIATGDVNGDGALDIVTNAGTILFGDGKGGFPARKDYVVDGGDSVMLADFDGDGKIDIIIGTGNPLFLSGSATTPSLTVLFGQGAGAFLAAPISPSGVTSDTEIAQAIATADFDGDGIADVAFMQRPGSFPTVLKGKGNGEFLEGSRLDISDNSPLSLTTGDFNRDGKPDVAVLLEDYPSQSEVQIFSGKGDGTFEPSVTLPAPETDVGFLCTADWNGDGIPDLAATLKGIVLVWLGKGDGTFALPSSYAIPGAQYMWLASGDFNSDGKLDMAVANQSGPNVTLLLGKGDGTFVIGTATAVSVPSPSAGYLPLGPTNIVAADFDGDGHPDLAMTLANSQNIVGGSAILIGKGDGTFQAPEILSQPAISIAAADMNGDRIPDLILGLGITPAGTVILPGNGDGTFGPAAQISSSSLLDFAIADFNHDGTPDVAGGLLAFGIPAFLNLSQPPAALTVVSAASFALGPLAPGTIASAFGKDLATGTTSAGSFLLPTNLNGTSVMVQDSGGVSRRAPLFFVSPGQVNFVVPNGTALGGATVMAISGNGTTVTGQASILPFAPSLFTAGSSGIAAAYVVRISPENTQTVQPVFAEQSGGIVPVPIDISGPDRVYLTLFGTGFDAANADSTTVSIQGQSASVSYAGPQLQWSGLDQVNVLLPASLAGSGVASVVLTVAGKPANTVYVAIE